MNAPLSTTEHQKECRQLRFIVECKPLVKAFDGYYIAALDLPYDGLVVGAGISPSAAIDRASELFNELCVEALFDGRYTIQKEWTGAPQPAQVVRFCGDWLGSAREPAEAWRIAAGHKAHRRALTTGR